VHCLTRDAEGGSELCVARPLVLDEWYELWENSVQAETGAGHEFDSTKAVPGGLPLSGVSKVVGYLVSECLVDGVAIVRSLCHVSLTKK
jgi:hypothetical protein